MARRALIAVREVSGVAEFAARLVGEFGFEILAFGDAVTELQAKSVPYHQVEQEQLSGLLCDESQPIEILVANFREVEQTGRRFLSWKAAVAAFDHAIVAAIRLAAQRPDRVAVVGEAEGMRKVMDELASDSGKVSSAFRMERAIAALRAASAFDFAVAQYLEVQGASAPDLGSLSGYPKAIQLVWPRNQLLDTGENRHQHAAIYGSFDQHFVQITGEKIGYEQALTLSNAAFLIGEFEKPTVALLCKGKLFAAASGDDLDSILRETVRGNVPPRSYAVVNATLGDSGLARIVEAGVQGVLAPEFSQGAAKSLATGSGLQAFKAASGIGYEALHEVRSIAGGALVQDKDRASLNPMEWIVQSFAQPLIEDWEPLLFAAKLARHSNSSTLLLARGETLLALESGRLTSEQCWRNLEVAGIDYTDTVAVFDEAEVDPETLLSMKKSGVRAVLLPAGEGTATLAAAANECGLVLLTLSKSLKRL